MDDSVVGIVEDSSDADDPARRGAPLGTLERGLFLLSLFTADSPEWSLKELRDASQLPKATIRRLVLSLERLGWLSHDPAAGVYGLGPRIAQFLYAKTSTSTLARLARPHLQALAQETTESALVAVWGHHGALTVDLVTTPRHFKPFTSLGMVMPGLATADAQVLTAFAPEAEWDARFFAVHGEVDAAASDSRIEARQRWASIRETGVAYDREQWKPGVCAVAAPVLDATGHAIASISVVIPSERASEEEMELSAAAVRRAAAAVSREHSAATRVAGAPSAPFA